MEKFDLIVIGSGPAGEKGAAAAAFFGRRVALIEKEDHYGGAAANTGTLPSKTLRETAVVLSGLKHRKLLGLTYNLEERVNIQDFHCSSPMLFNARNARRGYDIRSPRALGSKL